MNARRIALRFRKKGWQWLLTVKSAAPVSGGLALRNEWETPARPGQFDFSHVDAPEFKAALDEAQPRLQAIFTTDFRRMTWRVPFGHSLIELALDRGKIAMNGTPREIFAQVDRLRALRLDVPPMTRLAQLLRKRGLDISQDVLDVDDMVREVKRLCPSCLSS